MAIARIILGERDVEIECQADADDLAAAVRRSSSVHPDAMAGHERFPDGSRVLTEQPPGDLPLAEQRAMICTAISHSVGGTLTIRTRPLTSNPPIDAFAKCVVDPAMTVKNISASKKFDASTQEQILDRLLLVCFDALFLDAALTWTARSVSNLHCSETLPIAKYFIRGLSVGDKPLFRGMCAYCARLLTAPSESIVGWKVGPPIDRHGQRALDENGSPDLRAQPPCLLRYSPSLYAKEAPTVFAYDEATNRLTIKPGQVPPWLRPSEHLPPGDPNIWIYCEDCYTQCPEVFWHVRRMCNGRCMLLWWRSPMNDEPDDSLTARHLGPVDRRKSAQQVPFRDKASQVMMRPTWRSQQRREQADAEATAGAAVATDLDFERARQELHEEGSDVADEAMGAVGADVESLVGEPESEPDSEAREAKPQPKAAVEDNGSDADSVDDGCAPAEEDALPVLPQESRPSLEEYTAKWERLLQQHSKPVEGEYSVRNLVPTPIHQLWQDCPYVPFEQLISEEAIFLRAHMHAVLDATEQCVQRLNPACPSASRYLASLRRAGSEGSSGTPTTAERWPAVVSRQRCLFGGTAMHSDF